MKDTETNKLPEIYYKNEYIEELKMMELHFIELPKRKYMDTNDELWAWAEFLKVPNSGYLNRDRSEDGEEKDINMKSIRDAQSIYDDAIANSEEREKIRLLEKTQRDNLSANKAEIYKAVNDKAVETAKKMLSKGFSLGDVSDCSGLSIGEIKALQN